MLDTPLPTYVDARKAFKEEGSVSGYMELAKLERVAASTVDQAGRIEASLEFVEDSAGKRHVRGTVSGRLHLSCQRCLEPVAVDVTEQLDLVLVSDEEAAIRLDKKYDPWLCEDHRVMLADILDEQLLLGMPIVSYHQSGPCADNTAGTAASADVDATSPEKSKRSPFAVLADLKLD